jgi:hypothetical protein
MIWSGITTLLIFFFVPETYHSVLLKHKAHRLRTETGNDAYKAALDKDTRSIRKTILISCLRPFQLLIFEPMVLLLCIFTSLLLGILYLFFGAFPLVFEHNHHFNLWQVGMSFFGLFFGMLVALATSHFWSKDFTRRMKRHEAAGHPPGYSEPEDRLPPTVFGAVLVPIGLFWFGWTTYSSVHWIVPIIGSAVFAAGNFLVFVGVFTFFVDTYTLYAASALAANSFLRSSFAGAFPLFGLQMYNKLGYQWATSLLAFLSLIMAPWPYIFYKSGKQIRKRSRYAKSN